MVARVRVYPPKFRVNADPSKAAHILYDDNPRDELCIRAAKHELNQQIFTKTMTVQIWRPEFERPGRYFVYTSGYVRFFVDLLSQSRDKSGLETLARKVRKKQGEYFDHTTLWHDLCDVYLGVSLLNHLTESVVLIFLANPQASCFTRPNRTECDYVRPPS